MAGRATRPCSVPRAHARSKGRFRAIAASARLRGIPPRSSLTPSLSPLQYTFGGGLACAGSHNVGEGYLWGLLGSIPDNQKRRTLSTNSLRVNSDKQHLPATFPGGSALRARGVRRSPVLIGAQRRPRVCMTIVHTVSASRTRGSVYARVRRTSGANGLGFGAISHPDLAPCGVVFIAARGQYAALHLTPRYAKQRQ